MPFALELHFDKTSARRLCALWTQLQQIYGVPRRSELGTQPHVSLAVLAEQPAAFAESVRLLATDVGPFDIELGAVDSFPGDEGVVFIEAIVSPALERLHVQVNDVMLQLGLVNSSHYQPENWRPHCTIATDVPSALLSRVKEVAGSADWPHVVRVESLCGVTYRPATIQFRVPFEY